MAFCANCGAELNDGSSFCPKCGAAVGAPAAAPYTPYVAPGTTASGLQENVAGMLCYLVGWITGIVFLLIDKRPFVRFHAAQSIVIFGALSIIRIILALAFSGSWYFGFGLLHLLVFTLFGLFSLVAWIVLMIQAYQGKRYEVPIAADVAKNIAGSVH